SHNPFPDNGIKLFAAGGRKLSDDVEEHLEGELRNLLADGGGEPHVGATVGTIVARPDATTPYEDHVAASLEGRDLSGMTIAVDCANGATSAVAPRVLERLGAKVIVSHAEPDGVNINDACGSTYPASLQALVLRS